MRNTAIKTAGAMAIAAAMLGSCGATAYAADTTYDEVDEIFTYEEDGDDTEILPPVDVAFFDVQSPASKTLRVELFDFDSKAKYQIRYSANKNMKGSKVLDVSSKSGVKTFKVGSNDKKYFIEVRKGTKSKGKTTWSKWGDKLTGAAIAPPKITSLTSPKAKTLRVKVAKAKGKGKVLEYNVEYTGGSWIYSGLANVSKSSRQKTFTVGKSGQTYKARACVWKKIGGEYFRSAYGPSKTVVCK